MNDLRGILLFLMLLGLPFVASVNLECRKHFTCINTTYFNICVDFGDGKLRTIEGLIYPCPSGFVCDETNINECQLPVITTPTLPSSTPTSFTDNSTAKLNVLKDVSVATPLSTPTSDNPDQTKIIPKYDFKKEDSQIIKENTTKDNVTLTYLITEKTFPMITNITETNPKNNTTFYKSTSLETVTENELTVYDKISNGTSKMASNSSEFNIRLASYRVIPEGNSSVMKNAIGTESLLFNGSKGFNKISKQTVNNKISPSRLDINIIISSNNDTSQSIHNTSLPIDISKKFNTVSNNNASEKSANTTKYDIYSPVTKPTIPNNHQFLELPNMYSTIDINTKFVGDMPHKERTNQTKNTFTIMVEGESQNKANHTKIVPSFENFTEKNLSFSATEHGFLNTTFNVRTIPSTVQNNNIKGILPKKNNFTQTDTNMQYNTSTEYTEILRNFTLKIMPAKKTAIEMNDSTTVITTISFTDQTKSTINTLEDKNVTLINDIAKMINNNYTRSTTKATTNKDNLSIKNEQPLFTEATLTYVPSVNINATTLILDINRNVSEGINNNSYNNFMVTTNSPIVTTEVFTTIIPINKFENTTKMTTINEDIPSSIDYIKSVNHSEYVNWALMKKSNTEIVNINTEFDATTETMTNAKSSTVLHTTSSTLNRLIENVFDNATEENLVIKTNATETFIVKTNNKYNKTRIELKSENRLNEDMTKSTFNISRLENTIETATSLVDLRLSTENIPVLNVSKLVNLALINKANITEVKSNKLALETEVTTTSITVNSYDKPELTVNRLNENRKFAVEKNINITNNYINKGGKTASAIKTQKDAEKDFNENVDILSVTSYTKHNFSKITNEPTNIFDTSTENAIYRVTTSVEQMNTTNNTYHATHLLIQEKLQLSVGQTYENVVTPSYTATPPSSNVNNLMQKENETIFKGKTNKYKNRSSTEYIISTDIPVDVPTNMAVTPATLLKVSEERMNTLGNYLVTTINTGTVEEFPSTEATTTFNVVADVTMRNNNENSKYGISKHMAKASFSSGLENTTEKTTPNTDLSSSIENKAVSNISKPVNWLPRNKSNILQVKTNTFASMTEVITTSTAVNSHVEPKMTVNSLDENIKLATEKSLTITNNNTTKTGKTDIIVKISSNKRKSAANNLNENVGILSEILYTKHNFSNEITNEPTNIFDTSTDNVIHRDTTPVAQMSTRNNTYHAVYLLKHDKIQLPVGQINENLVTPSYTATPPSSSVNNVTPKANEASFKDIMKKHKKELSPEHIISTDVPMDVSTNKATTPVVLLKVSEESMNKLGNYLVATNPGIVEQFTSIAATTMLNEVTEVTTPATLFKVNKKKMSKLDNYLFTTTNTAVIEQFPFIEATTTPNVIAGMLMNNNNENSEHVLSNNMTKTIHSFTSSLENTTEMTTPNGDLLPPTENIAVSNISKPVVWSSTNMSNILKFKTNPFVTTTEVINTRNTVNSLVEPNITMNSLNENMKYPVKKKLSIINYNATRAGKTASTVKISNTRKGAENDLNVNVDTLFVSPNTEHDISNEITNQPTNIFDSSTEYIYSTVIEQFPFIEATTTPNVIAGVSMNNNNENSEHVLSNNMTKTMHSFTSSLENTTEMTTPNADLLPPTENIAVSNISKPVVWSSTNMSNILKFKTNPFVTTTEVINTRTTVNSLVEPNTTMNSLNENMKYLVKKKLSIINYNATRAGKTATTVKISNTRKGAENDLNLNVDTLFVSPNTEHDISNEITNQPTNIFDSSTEYIYSTVIEQFPFIEATTTPNVIAGVSMNNNNENSEHVLSNNMTKTMHSFTSSLENTTEMTTPNADLLPPTENIAVSNISKPVVWSSTNMSNILKFKTNPFVTTTEVINTRTTVNSLVEPNTTMNSLNENMKYPVKKKISIIHYNATRAGKTATTVKISNTRKGAENDLNVNVDTLFVSPNTEHDISNEITNQPTNIFDSSTEYAIHRDTTPVDQMNTTSNTYHAAHLLTQEQLLLPVGQTNEKLVTPSYSPTGPSSVNDLMPNENDTTFKGKTNKYKNQSSTEYIISTDIPMNVSTKKAITPAMLLKVSEESMNKLGNYLVTTINTGIVEQFPTIEATTTLNVVADATMKNNYENSEYGLNNNMSKIIHSLTSSLKKTTEMTTPNADLPPSTENIAVLSISNPVVWSSTNMSNILVFKTNTFATTTDVINASTTVKSHVEPDMTMNSLKENTKLTVEKSLNITNNNTTKSGNTAGIVKTSYRQKSTKNDINVNVDILSATPYTKHNFSKEVTNDPANIFETSTEDITNDVTIPMDQINTTNNTYRASYLLAQEQLQLPVRQTNENLLTPSYTATAPSSSVHNLMRNETPFKGNTNKDKKQLSTEYITSTDIPIDVSTNVAITPRLLLKVSKESMNKLDKYLVATTNTEIIKQFPSIESTTALNVITGMTMNNSNENSEYGLNKNLSKTTHNLTSSLKNIIEIFNADLPLQMETIETSNDSKPLYMALTNRSNIVADKTNTHATTTEVNTAVNYRVEPKMTVNSLDENTKLAIENNLNITNNTENIFNTANTSTVKTTQMKNLIIPSTNISFTERNFVITDDYKKDLPLAQSIITKNIVQGDVFLFEETTINDGVSHVQQKNITKEIKSSVFNVETTLVIPPAKNKIEETQNKLKVDVKLGPNFTDINYTTTLKTFSTNMPPSLYVENTDNINKKTKIHATGYTSELLKSGVINVDQNISSTELPSHDIASLPSLNPKEEIFTHNNESHIQYKINTTDKSHSYDNLRPAVLHLLEKNKTTINMTKSGSQIESSERVVTSKNVYYQNNSSSKHKIVDFNTTNDVRKITPTKIEMFRTENFSKVITAVINTTKRDQQNDLVETVNNGIVVQGKSNTTNIIDTLQPLKKVVVNVNGNISVDTENSTTYIIGENRYDTPRPTVIELMENVAVHSNNKPQVQHAKVNNSDNDIITATKRLLDAEEIFISKKVIETSTVSIYNTTRRLFIDKLIVESPKSNNTRIGVMQQNSYIEKVIKATTIVNYTATESATDKILKKITEKIPIFEKKTNGTQRHDLNMSKPLKFDCSQKSPGKYAESDDCRTFYICVAKRYPVVKKCPADTVFSEIRKQCTKNLAHCIRHKEFQCPSAGRFRDITKDNYYYICVMNKQNKFVKFKFQCQDGFHLNASSITCMWESPNQSSNSEFNGIGIGPSSATSMTSKVSSSAHKHSTEDIKCKTEGKFADLNDCRKYYECSEKNNSFRKKIKKCGSDEVFHSEKKSITLSSSNNMKNNGERTEEATRPAQNYRDQKNSLSLDCRHKNRGKYADQNDCKTYYVCIGKYNALIRYCPEYMIFSEMENKCTKNLSHCIRQNEFKCTSNGKFIDIFKHNYYYICVWNKANNNYLRYHLKCEDGFYLDTSSIKCMRQEKYESSSSVLEQQERSIESNQDSNKSETQEAPKGSDFKCVVEGQFSDPYNNKKYYICLKKHGRFRKKKKKCKRGEVFHKVKKQCVSAEIYE